MKRINTDARKYVVFDVETNGLNAKTDDLLSISFYKPDDGHIYNRFLPLELSKKVKTTQYNGITKKDLIGKAPLTQDEFNTIIETFELDKRTILTYSGRGFDERFLREYLQRKHIRGFSKLTFYNFKRQLLSSRYSGGNVTKDNLCTMFGIQNVQKVHSGINDCRVEWELFKKLDGYYYLITEGNYSYDNVFRMSPSYIVPVSYLTSHPNFNRLLHDRPYISCKEKTIKKFSVSANGLVQFGTNFDGMIIEHLIDVMLNAQEADSMEFLIKNKRKLKYVGGIPSAYHDVPMQFNPNGTLTAINKSDKSSEEEINRVLAILQKKLVPMIDFIKNNIFKGKEIISQELVIDKEQNILALCDLSTDDAVMEIKTNDAEASQYKEQFFYESRGRKCYHLSMEWKRDLSSNRLKQIIFFISEVEVEIGESPREQWNQLRREIQHKATLKKLQERLEPQSFQLIDYSNPTEPVKIKCTICKTEQEISYQRALHSAIRCFVCNPKPTKAPYCRKYANAEERQKDLADKFYMKVNTLSNNTLSVSEYKGSGKKITVVCKKCGNTWDIQADHLIQRCFCPSCKRNYR